VPKFLLVFLFCLPSFTFAAQLELRLPNYLRVGDTFTPQVLLRLENEVIDVTHRARYMPGRGLRSFSSGRFEVLPIDARAFYETGLQVNVLDTELGLLTTRQNIRVSSTPDRVTIRGPWTLRRHGFYRYQAEACFSRYSMCYDVTSQGRWYSRQGRIDFRGLYFAPGYSTNDTIEFSFGGRNDYLRVSVY
jgi:hypothetical protein